MAALFIGLFMMCVLLLGKPNPDVETLYYDAEFSPLYDQESVSDEDYARPKKQSVPQDAEDTTASDSSGSMSVDEALDLYNSIDMD